jgi:Phosphorylase superfamily
MAQREAKDLLFRPNTRVDDSLLLEKVLLCCGEDPTELLLALPAIQRPIAYHEYRCYKFWRFEPFTLVWSGIGTGCLEPLLYELLVAGPNSSRIQAPPRIHEIVLIGTAGGLLSEGRCEIGEAYLIDKAYLGGSALIIPEHDISFLPKTSARPLTPHLGSMDAPFVKEIRTSSVVSSDYYYGFSTESQSKQLRERDRHLREAVNAVHDYSSIEMVDMETAQYYYFCDCMGGGSLSYAAVRGPANSVGNFHKQPSFSLNVLRSACKIAFRLLSLEAVGR